MRIVPNLTLNNGVTIPQLGFGVFQVPEGQTQRVVEDALGAGYRHIDTAAACGNEAGVGAAIAASGVAREEIFITTKLRNGEHGTAAEAFEASRQALGVDVIDLYLIHWPVPAQDAYVDTWRALLQLRADGRIRAAGVCNFQQPHLQRLIDETGEAPAINQIELHPYLQQSSLRAFHAQTGILTEAWSPLAQGGPVLVDPTITGMAAKHSRSPAQVILRWHLQLGNVVIPKSVTPSRIAENLDVFGFELDARDMSAIEALNSEGRTGPDPDKLNPSE